MSEEINESNEVRFTMRMESGLYECLKNRAKRNKRSVAKELEFITQERINQDVDELALHLQNILKMIADKQYPSENLKEIINNKNDKSPFRQELLAMLKLVNNIDIENI